LTVSKLTESDYVTSLHSLLKERVANGLTACGKIFSFMQYMTNWVNCK